MNTFLIPNTVAIVGLGLIGGSIGLELEKHKPYIDIIGVENSPENASRARERGLTRRTESLDDAIVQSDMIILATPPDVTLKLLPGILDKIDEQIVTDVCSVKHPLIEAVAHHPRRGRYLAAHPMAGTEYSGPDAALNGLFSNKACIFCDTNNTDDDAIALGQWLFQYLGMRLTEMEPVDHDRHAAYVSHISHITSFALAITVLEKEKSDQHIFDMASGGFDSTVRLAKSAASMWNPVFQLNKQNMLDVLDNYTSQLKRFRDALAANDQKGIEHLIHQSNKIKKVIK